jgi:hypothetical protein
MTTSQLAIAFLRNLCTVLKGNTFNPNRNANTAFGCSIPEAYPQLFLRLFQAPFDSLSRAKCVITSNKACQGEETCLILSTWLQPARYGRLKRVHGSENFTTQIFADEFADAFDLRMLRRRILIGYKNLRGKA